MNNRLRVVRVAALVLAGWSGLLLSPGSEARARISPFVDDGVVADAQGPPEPGVRRSRLVAVDVGALEAQDARRGSWAARQPAISFEVFPDVYIVAVFDRFEASPAGRVWVGHVEDEPDGHVTLVYGNGLLSGSISSRRGTFQIRPAGETAAPPTSRPASQVHVIRDVDLSALPREAEPVDVGLFADALDAAPPVPAGDSAPVIDVMVVYTPTARANAGGAQAIEQLIALGLSETNASYANSGINQRVRLVHAAPVAYAESSDFGVNLSDLRTGAGTLNGVAALRDRYGADLVMMLVHPSSPSACGIAYVMTTVSTAFAPYGYSVVDTACVSPNYTMAHEWGHNMGGQHDWYVTRAVAPYTYSHGYVNPATGHRWRTVMAYNDHCSVQGFTCRRLLAWANSTRYYNPFCDGGTFVCATNLWYLPGEATGIAPGTRSTCVTGNVADTRCDADDRLALNNTAATVAAFRNATMAAYPPGARDRP
jgi:hypothetical protein